MRYGKTLIGLLLICCNLSVVAQDEVYSRQPVVSIFTGLINYEGDLNPNSFTLGRSAFTFGASVHKPLNRWFAIRAGINYGNIQAADQYNRDYLKPRNLSFYTTIKEAYAALELDLLNISKTRFTPYLFAGLAIFHFNPWTYDNEGQKIYLKPLSTEGEGLKQFPSQRPYHLTQFSLPYGIGVRYAVNTTISVGFEFSQRKTFTDYLDDVSSFYVDRQTLLSSRGPKAVELAYRGLPAANSNTSYPAHGEQRGTPTEMDWYYSAGLTVGIKLNAFKHLFNEMGGRDYHQGCPKIF